LLTGHALDVTTPSDLLADRLRRDGSRPFITFYDDATGERVELSVATTANWVAKTANFFVDEHGIGPGDTIGVRLPLHWQSAIVILAAWAAGAAVSFGTAGTLDVVAGSGEGAADRIELSLAPMGADFGRLVAAQPDEFVAIDAVGADVVEAAPVDLPAAARVLCTASLADGDGLGYGLVAPLAVDGSVVYVAHPDPTRLPERAAAEQVTHTLGVGIPGLPRL
jgi:uncharacterized protein (TIGR03089 family)